MALLLNEGEVDVLVRADDWVEPLMADALRALVEEEIVQPLRTVVAPRSAPARLGVMPAYTAFPAPLWGAKVLCFAPANRRLGLDSHQGVVLLLDGETGKVRTIANAAAVTRWRTAGVSAVSVRALARPDAEVLTVVGTGSQAQAHLEVLAGSRSFREIRVAGRTWDHMQSLAARDVRARAIANPEAAVRGADVVLTATSSNEPVIRREWLMEGAHVTAVGATDAGSRELDGATVAASALFVDSVEAAEAEAGAYLLALEEGSICGGHIRATLGDVLAGRHPGRASESDLTVFLSVGLAAQDLFLTAELDRRARELRVGIELEL